MTQKPNPWLGVPYKAGGSIISFTQGEHICRYLPWWGEFGVGFTYGKGAQATGAEASGSGRS